MSWGWGGGRRGRGGYGGGGYGGGPWAGGGFGRGRWGNGGYGGGPWGGGYGGGPYQRGGGGCLRDVLLVETGCCLAEALGCGPQLLFAAPRVLVGRRRNGGAETWALRLVRAYRTDISPRRRRPCCRMEPSCSAYAEEALLRHGTRRGLLLAARRLLRCRPGGPRGYDPVPES